MVEALARERPRAILRRILQTSAPPVRARAPCCPRLRRPRKRSPRRPHPDGELLATECMWCILLSHKDCLCLYFFVRYEHCRARAAGGPAGRRPCKGPQNRHTPSPAAARPRPDRTPRAVSKRNCNRHSGLLEQQKVEGALNGVNRENSATLRNRHAKKKKD